MRYNQTPAPDLDWRIQLKRAQTPTIAMTRRDTLRLLTAAPFAVRSISAQRIRPNVLVLLADDLGYGDLAFTGCPDVKTPNLDRLATQSVTFTQAYCNGPVCSPTRAALLTGQYPQRNDMDEVILVDQRERGLNTRAVMLPQVLKLAGYTTGIIGKWHLGFKPEFLPTRRGFDEFKGFLAGNIDYFAHIDRRRQPDLWDGERPLTDSRYMTDFIAEESMGFIHRNAGKQPFFLYVAFNAVHDPFQGPGDRDSAGDFEISDKKNATRKVYRTMIESLDLNAGRILEHLRKEGMEENTVVFFMSDNGGISDIGRNLPFSGHKGQLWEGGIRTPFLARWLGHFNSGSKCNDMVAGFDIFPTCAALAGASLPAGLNLDGVSILGACLSEGSVKRDEGIYFHAGTQHALIRGRLKYLRDAGGGEHIFDLQADPGEEKDISQSHKPQMDAMTKDYQRWLFDVFSGKVPLERNRTGS